MKTFRFHLALLVIVNFSQASFPDIVLEDKVGFRMLRLRSYIASKTNKGISLSDRLLIKGQFIRVIDLWKTFGIEEQEDFH